MIIGLLKEIKDKEHRVALLPSGVKTLTEAGHTVFFESGCGLGIGIHDDEYKFAGGKISNATHIFLLSDLLVKVKEPQPSEIAQLRPGQKVFGYMHLASDRELTDNLLKSGATCIAYETVVDQNGARPLLAPMSEIAGRLSIIQGIQYLQHQNGGNGILLNGMAGIPPAKVVILGAGVVGKAAIANAVGLGASVTVFDRSVVALSKIIDIYGSRVITQLQDPIALADSLKDADLVVGSVANGGHKANKLITVDMIKSMKPRSVLVDVSIDQGGCSETSRPTSHTNPIYVAHGITHYCVTNMPSLAAKTATTALTNATLPYILNIAKHPEDAGYVETGLCIHRGILYCPDTKKAFGL